MCCTLEQAESFILAGVTAAKERRQGLKRGKEEDKDSSGPTPAKVAKRPTPLKALRGAAKASPAKVKVSFRTG